MVYGIYNELVTGAYKPTQNWGGHIVPELVVLCLCFLDLCLFDWVMLFLIGLEKSSNVRHFGLSVSNHQKKHAHTLWWG